MRKQSRYLPEDIETGLFTSGSEWQTADGTEYVGLYHRYNTGEVYTKAEWYPNSSQQLFEYRPETTANNVYYTLRPDINVTYESVPEHRVQPTAADIARGFVTRYIALDMIQGSIRDVNQATYQNIQNRRWDSNRWRAVQVEWKITGETQDQTSYQGTTLGIESYNRQAIRVAERQIPGLSRYITNYTTYAADSDFIVPRDINPR